MGIKTNLRKQFFVRQISPLELSDVNVDQANTLHGLQSVDLKGETERFIMDAQDQSLFTSSYQAIMQHFKAPQKRVGMYTNHNLLSKQTISVSNGTLQYTLIGKLMSMNQLLPLKITKTTHVY